MRAQAAALAGALVVAGSAPGLARGPSHFVCDVGPVARDFAGAPWFVYSCGDGRTLLFKGAPGGKAALLYFEISLDPDGVRLGARSAQGRDATGAAFKEVSALSRDRLVALLSATKSARARTP